MRKYRNDPYSRNRRKKHTALWAVILIVLLALAVGCWFILSHTTVISIFHFQTEPAAESVISSAVKDEPAIPSLELSESSEEESQGPIHSTGEKIGYNFEDNIIYQHLSGPARRIYRSVRSALEKGQSSVVFRPPVSQDDLYQAMQIYLEQDYDNLGLDPTAGWSSSINDDNEVVSVSFTPRLSAQDYASTTNIMYGAADEIIMGTEGMSDVEKVIYFNDWIVEHTEYDENARGAHDVTGVLLDGRSVCEGYAKAMSLLLNRSGIPAIIMTGFARDSQLGESGLDFSTPVQYDELGSPVLPEGMNRHAWVAVQLSDGWYYVDPTYNDPIISDLDDPSLPVGRHNYLLLSFDDMERNRQFAPYQFALGWYPTENHEGGSWFERMNRVAYTEDDCRRIFREQAQTNAPVIEMRIAEPALYADVTDTRKQKVMEWVDGLPSLETGSYRMATDDSLQIVEFIFDYQ